MGYKRLFEKNLNKIKNRKKEEKKIVVIALASIMLGGGISGVIVHKIAEKNEAEAVAVVTENLTEEAEKKIAALERKLEKQKDSVNQEEEPLPWYLVLVNYENPMEEGYVPELTSLKPGYSVDSRIAEAAQKMLSDAKEEGLRIVLCSAYRSVERQEELFNQNVGEHLKKGMSYWEAFETTRISVAEPKTSEHALGLALDLISYDYDELDEGQEQTKEAQWLAKNCHKYGFILRYPPAKTDITRIIYEPWHYRYVGVEDATKIMELGITLEEYLEYYY